jgi:putative signal transducing protein
MYCPNPRCADLSPTGVPAEFMERISVCPACGVELVMSMPGWANTSHEGSACVPCMTIADSALLPHIKGILDAEGVQYFVKNEGLQNLLGWGTVGLGFNQVFGPPVIMVAAEQLEFARGLLRDFDESNGPGSGLSASPSTPMTEGPSRCTRCGHDLESDQGDEVLAHRYYCGSPLSVD